MGAQVAQVTSKGSRLSRITATVQSYFIAEWCASSFSLSLCCQHSAWLHLQWLSCLVRTPSVPQTARIASGTSISVTTPLEVTARSSSLAIPRASARFRTRALAARGKVHLATWMLQRAYSLRLTLPFLTRV